MNKTELKRLARHMAANFLRELAENDTALENGLEIFGKYLEDEEAVRLTLTAFLYLFAPEDPSL